MSNIAELLQSTPQRHRKKPPYRKPESIKELEKQYFEYERSKRPDFPYPVKTQFRDDTTNTLTKSIKAWFTLNGGHMARINTTGIYDTKLRRYRFSGSTKGTADLVGTYRGRSVSVEVKYGRDTQSEAQKKYQQQAEAAGGIYIIASTFDNFLEQIKIITD